jgi:hypothetical protein
MEAAALSHRRDFAHDGQQFNKVLGEQEKDSGSLRLNGLKRSSIVSSRLTL